MALVAMTSVQLTTPRRTFLQAAGSAANSGEVAMLLRARVNRLRRIKLCMVALHRQCILLWDRASLGRVNTLRCWQGGKSHPGDQHLHGGDHL
ncbi:hypothetical protein D3C71_1630980 [compost metagenome]